ncbi:hypothetical protein ASD86_03605 [Lysobacter sp. Root690]|nr:hypothetical protein ASD86_03605 [Lysobacter sp. Root690]
MPARDKAPVVIDMRKSGSGWTLFGVVLLAMGIRTMLDPFVPSLEAAWLGPVMVLLAAAVALGVIVLLYGWPLSLASSSDRRHGGAIQVLLCVACFFIAHSALRFGLPILLHHLAGPRPATQIEAVRVRESSFRGCRTSAVLPGDGFLLRRRLCTIPPNTFGALRHSERIELRGKRSYFGISVEGYDAAPRASR